MRSIEKARRQQRYKITDFRLEGVIGIGNFGKVYKAINRKEDRICALKCLKKESVAEMKHVDHVVNEREVLQYLTDINEMIYPQPKPLNKHSSPLKIQEDSESDSPPTLECPFVMQIYSSFQDKMNLYFELEYIEGCTLLS